MPGVPGRATVTGWPEALRMPDGVEGAHPRRAGLRAFRALRRLIPPLTEALRQQREQAERRAAMPATRMPGEQRRSPSVVFVVES